MTVVGRNVPRKDGALKVSGKATYVDDLSFPGMLYGRTIRSTIPFGRIHSVHLDTTIDGLVAVDYRDIPGRNVVTLIEEDQPFLVQTAVHHAAEPVLLLAHPDREKLLAVEVDIQYKEGTPLLDVRASDTVFKEILIEKGDLSHGFSQADVVVEGEYRSGHQEQLYIEPNGMIAVPENGGIAVHGSMQCPYYIHKALKVLLGLPDDKVRVVALETGGGFGGKEEYPSLLAGHAALLALKANRPVKMVYDRLEDLEATTKRHPSITRIRTGLKRDGRLTAIEIDTLIDAGAYTTLSPVVLSRGAIHAAGPYRCDNILIHGRAVMTHTPPNGAFRGFGAPQTQFAHEVHMERIAQQLEIDPVTFRAANALRPGDKTATGQVMGEDCGALAVLEEAAGRTEFQKKRQSYAASHRGIGLSLIFHGSGFTGSGEVNLASKAALRLTEEGVRILAASTEIGQGTRTIHAQIVADTLGIPYEQVETANPDTADVPNSGPTVASRTCMVVGAILGRCAEEMKERLGDLSPLQYYRRHGPLLVTRQYEPPAGITWDEESHRGDAYATYAWACVVAEVEVDADTFEARPLSLTAVQDIGKAIHPTLAAGQVEGGSAQGIGYAILEEVVMQGGKMANAQLTNYIIPTTLDTPQIDVVFLNNPYRHGPFGAKGIGELPIDGPAPAVINAIRHTGVDIRSIPATPEQIMEALCASD
ncbi:MAG: xanthine dehydrogenase family protein molybdopterin-binding subunit [Acidobacteriota bacterium]